MGLRIATNVNALNAGKNLYSLGNQQSTTMARLASGYRINNASDDAAGLAISEGMKANIRGLGKLIEMPMTEYHWCKSQKAV